MSFWPYPQREISVLTELNLGHLRCSFEGVPPQPNFLSSPIPQGGKHNSKQGSGFSRSIALPPRLHPRRNYTRLDQSEALQGLLSPLDS